MEIRLNKFISDSGYCSRREADRFIESKKVTINRQIAHVGDKVYSKDIVKVNGNLIEQRDEYIYIVLNKPVGITCTTDTSDSRNVIDLVNYPTRIFHIGRLDKDSEGLILLTDNGDIVNKILRSGNNHEKEYEVTVDKSITPGFIEAMGQGVTILGTTTKKCKIEKEGDKHFRIILTQGLNRQIRRMCETLGYEVIKLKRVRVMNITLHKLPLEQWRFLEPEEIADIFELTRESKNEKRIKSSTSSQKKFKSKPYKGKFNNSEEETSQDSRDSRDNRSSRGKVNTGRRDRSGSTTKGDKKTPLGFKGKSSDGSKPSNFKGATSNNKGGSSRSSSSNSGGSSNRSSSSNSGGYSSRSSSSSNGGSSNRSSSSSSGGYSSRSSSNNSSSSRNFGGSKGSQSKNNFNKKR